MTPALPPPLPALPPPLLLNRNSSRATRSSRLKILAAPQSDDERIEIFGAALAESRLSRRLLGETLVLFAPADDSAPPSLVADQLWVPHIYAWEELDAISLAWERCARDEVETLLGARPEAVALWASRSAELVTLGRRAAVEATRHCDTDRHLSLRWILDHETQVARLMSEDVVTFEHISLHVAAGEEAKVIRLLTDALGMVEIVRPAKISIPGRWLQAGSGRVHLNSRGKAEGEEVFPGSTPNHVCFAVADLDSAERAVQSFGIRTQRSGSLGNQVWFHLPGETVIELQPKKSGD